MLDEIHRTESAFGPQCFAYHEIAKEPSADVYCITPERLRNHLRTISAASRNSRRPFQISFDDGHMSNLSWAAPLLEEAGLRGHFFLPSAWISSRRHHMRWQDVRELVARGHMIGSHGATHLFLTSCSPEQLVDEIRGSRTTLEEHLGIPITTISMPGGRWNSAVLDACSRAGYEVVYTSEPGQRKIIHGTSGRLTVVGRLAVRQRVSLSLIESYAAGDLGTITRLKMLYNLRNRMKKLLGDRTYQQLWSSCLRAVEE